MTMDSHTLRSTLIRVGLQTLICIAASMAATTAVLMWRAEGDFAAALTVEQFWTMALAISAACPALLAPLLAWPAARRLHEVQRVRDELARAAHVDSLTGLLNRRGFDEAAKAAFAEGGRETGCDVAIMCDIDHFKAINDRYGHDFGDLALVHVAGVLDAVLENRRAIIGRLGGEEFAVLLPDGLVEEAQRLAEAMRSACEQSPIRRDGVEAWLTLSFGVAAAADRRELRPLMVRADAALYQAKREGRNRVVWAAGWRRSAAA